MARSLSRGASADATRRRTLQTDADRGPEAAAESGSGDVEGGPTECGPTECGPAECGPTEGGPIQEGSTQGGSTDADPGEADRARSGRRQGRIRELARQQILDAAEIEFVRHGLRGASMQAIADRAGLPKANVHYYFRSKLNLYRTLLNGILHRWNDFLEGVTAADDPAEVLERFIREKIRLARSHPRASRLFAQEIIQGAPHLKAYLRGEMREWLRAKARIIDAWVAAGRMDPVDPALLVFMIWSTTQHYADFETQVLILTNRREYDDDMIEEIGDFLTRVILKGCGVRTADTAAPALPDGAEGRS